jgi:hypothetical protein
MLSLHRNGNSSTVAWAFAAARLRLAIRCLAMDTNVTLWRLRSTGMRWSLFWQKRTNVSLESPASVIRVEDWSRGLLRHVCTYLLNYSATCSLYDNVHCMIMFIYILCTSIWSSPVQAVDQNVIPVNVGMDVTEDLKGLNSCFKGTQNAKHPGQSK